MPLDTSAAGQDDPGKEGQSSGLVKRRISSSSSCGGGGSQDLNQMELQQRHSSMMDEEGASQRKKRKFDVLYYKETLTREDGVCSAERRGLYICIVLLVLYNAYLAYAIYYHYDRDTEWLWCDGLGFVIICTALTYGCMLLSYVVKRLAQTPAVVERTIPVHKACLQLLDKLFVRLGIYFLVLFSVTLFLILDTKGSRERLISALGMVVLILLGTIFSKAPRSINWRQVTWGLALQFIFALCILRWDVGREVVNCLGRKINTFLEFTDDGSTFTFGYLVSRTPFIPGLLSNESVAYNVTSEVNEAMAVPGIVVFKSLSVIYFFSFIVNILFYYGTIQWLTEKIGWFLRITIGTTACESLNAASNIFLGQAMAPLLIQPYLSKLTRSEIHVVMTSGFSTIAGTTMAAYITFGVSPAHLLSASVMSAPAALAYGKLFYPETEESLTSHEDIKLTKEGDKAEANLIDAATRGAADAAQLVLNITAIVIAFIAFISFLNAVISFFGGLVGMEYITFEWLLGKIFIPLAWLMGIPWEECESVGYLIGIKSVVNEFIAYRELGIMIAAGQLSERSIAITTYALCGFANPGSVGVQLAILSGICPERKKDFAQIVMRAFVAGSVASFLTACIAGALLTEEGIENSQPPTGM